MKLFIKNQQESYKNAKEQFEMECAKDKKYRKVKDGCHFTGKHRGAAYSICHLKCSDLKHFLQVFITNLTTSINLS